MKYIIIQGVHVTVIIQLIFPALSMIWQKFFGGINVLIAKIVAQVLDMEYMKLHSKNNIQ